MKRQHAFIAAIIIIVLLAGCATSKPVIPSKVIDHVKAITVDVNCGVWSGTGIGVKAYDESYVITCNHLLVNFEKTCNTISVITYRETGAIVGGTPASIVARDADLDIAILKLKDPELLKGAAVFIEENELLKKGTPVIHFTTHGKNPTTIKHGVFRCTVPEDKNVVRTSHLTCPGSSGGGIFLTDGRCIGIGWGEWSPKLINPFGIRSTTRVITADCIRAFAHKHHVDRVVPTK